MGCRVAGSDLEGVTVAEAVSRAEEGLEGGAGVSPLGVELEAWRPPLPLAAPRPRALLAPRAGVVPSGIVIGCSMC